MRSTDHARTPTVKTTHRVRIALAAGAALLLGACATTGMGGGELARKGKADAPVLFTWKSDDGGLTGTMTAALPGATYKGGFFQITQQTRRELIAPLWNGWMPAWSDWPYWGPLGPYDITQFITRYSGKVVANLHTDAGQRMRCRLHLVVPARGMAGGCDGECQLQGGGTVHAKF